MFRPLIGTLALLLFVWGCGDATPPTLTAQGLRELRTGHYEQAIATCSKAIQQDPSDAEAYLYRGRAYQFRNAMGDPKKALADFGEAIRLAPDSADAYYSRAMVYRELGQEDLADADEMQARAADDLLQDVYRSLPTPRESPTIAEATDDLLPSKPPAESQQVLGDGLPESPFERRRMFEQLKRDFEPEQDPGETYESPFQRYNRLSREAARESRDDAAGSLRPISPSPALAPLGPPAAQPAPGFSPLPGPVTPQATPSRSAPLGANSPAGTAGPLPPAPQRDFRPVQSPFRTRPPAPTGFDSRPTNPFGQQSPRTVAPRQQRSSRDTRYSNPSVRPPNPRDYVP